MKTGKSNPSVKESHASILSDWRNKILADVGHKLTLVCEVSDIHDIVEYKWYGDGKLLVGGGSTHTFDVTRTTPTEYKCQVLHGNPIQLIETSPVQIEVHDDALAKIEPIVYY